MNSQVTESDIRLNIHHYINKNATVFGKEFFFDNKTFLFVRKILRTQTFKRKPVTLTGAKTPFFDLVVPVTGCSSNHYGKFKKQIAHFAKQFPGTSVIFYDLGLDN